MDIVDLVFFEKQEGQLCAQHALNALLQGQYFTAVDLSQIASDLDDQELATLDESSRAKFSSQNYDDSGFFSIQVIQNALAVWNLSLSPLASPSNAAAKADPASQSAFILNLNEHWLTLRKFGNSRNRWYNLDSTTSGPTHISEFYLQALLSQLSAEGYSIFVVSGSLPMCDADAYAAAYPIPAPVTQVRKESRNEKDGTTTQKHVPFGGRGYSLTEDFDNGELDLQKAISMSLEPATVSTNKPAETDADMVRRKRLEALARRNA
ncbi:Ataxin-3 [Entophlyctis luteolus]|nr:Ataxin-3 [Entophlyctis luteolus]KAJ3352022.1 Ataxin-3 [Entophlyctis luteolus]